MNADGTGLTLGIGGPGRKGVTEWWDQRPDRAAAAGFEAIVGDINAIRTVPHGPPFITGFQAGGWTWYESWAEVRETNRRKESAR